MDLNQYLIPVQESNLDDLKSELAATAVAGGVILTPMIIYALYMRHKQNKKIATQRSSTASYKKPEESPIIASLKEIFPRIPKEVLDKERRLRKSEATKIYQISIRYANQYIKGIPYNKNYKDGCYDQYEIDTIEDWMNIKTYEDLFIENKVGYSLTLISGSAYSSYTDDEIKEFPTKSDLVEDFFTKKFKGFDDYEKAVIQELLKMQTLKPYINYAGNPTIYDGDKTDFQYSAYLGASKELTDAINKIYNEMKKS